MDPVVQSFADEFERFHNFLLKQIEVCPEELWGKKDGGHYFWQELVHVLCCIQLYADPEGELRDDFGLGRQGVLLREDGARTPSKAEVLAYAGKMKALADAFLEPLTLADLAKPHAGLIRFSGKDKLYAAALVGLVRHYNYHIGCCDAVLRGHGLLGVY